MTLTKEQRSSLEERTSRYQKNLYLAGEYLAGRGITEATAVSARLGVVDEPIQGDSHAEGFRLSIPYLTRAGVVDIRYRCLRQHDCSKANCPKYLGGAGESLRIYGVGNLVSAGTWICVTEGELDSVILTQLGYPAVGLPGANSWKRHWHRLFEDFSRIIVFGDGDDAGRKFAQRLCEEFPGIAEAVQMDWKKDVTDMFDEKGREFFDNIIRA
jgi:5S rRNA maturation endonuclease (ribonuclease M5)